MSVVVERGLARCPRCVAVADYAFVESGPNCLRYEVRCGRCGESYCEVHAPLTPDFAAAVEALAVREEHVAAPGYRRRAVLRLAAAKDHVAGRTPSWIALRWGAFRS